MACVAGPKTPFTALKGNVPGSFWSPRVLSSLWQDTAGTVPAVVNSEVKRMNDLSGRGNHMLASTGTRTISSYTYTFKGPILRQEGSQYYLEFDGDGAALRCTASGSWPAVTGSNSAAVTLSVAFYTNSSQPALPSSGLGGTWLGTDSIGNFGNVWHFGLRLSTETMFYCTKRNLADTAWVEQWTEGDRYSLLTGAQWLNTIVIYTATGSIINNTIGGNEWINGNNTVNFSSVPFGDVSLLPVPFNNTFAIGARAPGNDNWIAGRFYGGVMLAKALTEPERLTIQDFLYTNCFL